MSRQVSGNLGGLASSELKQLNKLYHRKLDKSEIISLDFAREIYNLAAKLRRRIGVLIDRQGKIVEVVVGTKKIIYLPDLGRYRFSSARLRRLRLVFSDLDDENREAKIPTDIYTDLEKLRLDMVAAIKERKNSITLTYAHLAVEPDQKGHYTQTEKIVDLGAADFNFIEFIEALEEELARENFLKQRAAEGGALLVGVYSKKEPDAEGSIEELKELARTAGVQVLGVQIQKRDIDPKTLLGKGKLEEVVLECLRLGADMIIFDTELKPGQWRAITNSTELKVLDRSMLILDIFAQRASSSEGRLQVELAQLKYNLPKLVEKDAGLSRLTGGIGGRGPGETKLEIGRRRIRDRISELESRIDNISRQRQLRRKKRVENKLPLICIIGYTNVGKSTLFNVLTQSSVISEDKLFATLDPAQRRFGLVNKGEVKPVIISDTVGFIRDLPKELQAAFRATLEELQEADLFLHVLDVSDPRIAERKKSVEAVLGEMELLDIPSMIVLNKVDKIDQETAQALAREFGGILISAADRIGLDSLKNAMAEIVHDNGRITESASA